VWYGVTLEPGNHTSTSVSGAFDLWPFDPKFNRKHLPSMGSPYVWYGDSTWEGKHSTARKPYIYFDDQCTWPLTSNSKGNIFLPWVVHVCDIVTLGRKGNILQPGNHISTLMTSVLDLWPFNPKINGSIFLLWVVHMCGMVTLSRKDNVLGPGKFFYSNAQCTWPLTFWP
jgi:hypothetical protein